MAPDRNEEITSISWADVAASIILLGLYIIGAICFLTLSGKETVQTPEGPPYARLSSSKVGLRAVEMPGWKPLDNAGMRRATSRRSVPDEAITDKHRTGAYFRKDRLFNALHPDWRMRWVRPAANVSGGER